MVVRRLPPALHAAGAQSAGQLSQVSPASSRWSPHDADATAGAAVGGGPPSPNAGVMAAMTIAPTSRATRAGGGKRDGTTAVGDDAGRVGAAGENAAHVVARRLRRSAADVEAGGGERARRRRQTA